MLDKVADQTAKDLNAGIALNITELFAGLNQVLDRLDGATVECKATVECTFTVHLRPWTPKPTA
ncbi:MAG TPA: hypothetical protein VKX49_12500 [Bryobacteraceae bacterium]|nr:hypothetical protein [Bryobacteraceae bacterium]